MIRSLKKFLIYVKNKFTYETFGCIKIKNYEFKEYYVTSRGLVESEKYDNKSFEKFKLVNFL